MKIIKKQVSKLKELILSIPFSKKILDTELVKWIMAHPQFQKAFTYMWMLKNMAFYAFVFRVPLMKMFNSLTVWISLLNKNFNPAIYLWMQFS